MMHKSGFENFDKEFDKTFLGIETQGEKMIRAAKTAMWVSFVAQAGLWFTVGYVAFHFLRKMW